MNITLKLLTKQIPSILVLGVLLSFLYIATGQIIAQASTYDYQYLPPNYPTDPNQVVVWNVPETGGNIPDNLKDSNWNKYLLMVFPDTPVSGSITAKWLKHKGVYIIGGEFKKVGSIDRVTPETLRPLPGGGAMQIVFGSGAPIRPFLFIANIDFDIPTNTEGLQYKSYWGDFLQTGTNSTSTADWLDIYMQKIKIRKGHYFWTTPDNNNDPHSDVLHCANGGWHSLYAANMDFKWYGQGFFTVPSDIAGMNYPPPDGRVQLKDIVARTMPANTEVYTNGDADYLVHISSYHPTTLSPTTGKYYSIYLNNFNFLTRNTTDAKTSYFSTKNLSSSWNSSLNSVEFAYYKHENQAYPYFDGPSLLANKAYAKYHSSEATLPTVVDESEIGRGVRITTAQHLVNMIQSSMVPSVTVNKITFTNSSNQVIAQLPGSGTVKTSVELLNTSKQTISTVVVIALYDGNRLESIKTINPLYVRPESLLTVPTVETPLAGSTTQKKIKVFLWKDFNQLVPLAALNRENISFALPHNLTGTTTTPMIAPDYSAID